MVKRTKAASEQAAHTRSQIDAMAEVAKGFAVVRPGAEVVKKVTAVPTVFPYFDWKTKIGGVPVSKIFLVHGPSMHGKTPFMIGLGRSFLERDHFLLWGDFERATPEPWMKALLGPTWSHPGFAAVPPEVFTYEKVRVMHRKWAEHIAEQRDKGVVSPSTSGIFLVDSIRKLVPQGIWEDLEKSSRAKDPGAAKKNPSLRRGKGHGGMDGLGGRAGQKKAQLNAAWMDELVPLLVATQTSIAFISRETEEEGDDFFEETFKVGGGQALLYESSFWLRVTSTPVQDQPEGSDVKRLLGEKHTVSIRRSKVGAREHKVERAMFHTSTGVDSPLGFDKARDLFELGQELDVITLAGSHYSFLGHKANGRDAALAKVREHAAEVEAACRERFGIGKEKPAE